jgi:NAD(P)-dependent dehydrogenase (short-subunit alcohol dehydrogenase family)
MHGASELRQAAVDGDLAGGHEAAVVRREEGGHGSDLRRIGHALQRGHRAVGLLALLAERLFREFGRCRPRRQHVDPATVPTLFEKLDAEFTKRNGSKALDILVNNAGNFGFVGFRDATPHSWDTLIAVYARAPFFIVQAALDRLADGGRIINISSAAATKPVKAAPIYSMAKAAINNLTQALASELGSRGITANAVAPGYTRTDANAAFRENPELVKAVEAEIALGRFGEPSEIAAVVAFLASDEGHWVTGQTIEASGGYKL